MKPLLLQGFAGGSSPPPPSGALRWGTRCLVNTWSDVNALKPGLMVRRMFSWATIQPNAGGAYNWSEPDSWIPQATAAGIPVMAVLSKAPAWATGGAGAGNKYPAGHQDDFYRFCAASAARYPQPIWEIYNEPDYSAASGPWTSAQVAEILIGAANAMVAARSTAKVVGICTIQSYARNQSFVNPILQAIKGVSTIYGVSMHTYTRPNAPELASGGSLVSQMATSVGMMDAAGFTGKLFVTEFGDPTTYSGTRPAGYVSEANAALWLVRQSIIQASFARVERSIQFQLWGWSSSSEEGGMGLIRGANDRGSPSETSAGAEGSFKPGYISYKNMMRILDETTLSITAQSTGPVYKYRFDKSDGSYGYVVWVLSGSTAVSIGGLTTTVKVTQNNGSSANVSTDGGSITISATPAPQYIEPTADAPPPEPTPNDFFKNPFNHLSAHHRPIGSGAVYAGDSDPNTVAWNKTAGPNINSTNGWGVNTGVLDPSYPLKTIGVATDYSGCGHGLPVSLRIPPGFSVPANVDAVVTFYDPVANVYHDFYHWVNTGPKACLHYVAPADGLGNGLLPGNGQDWGCSTSGIWGPALLLRGFELTTPGMPIRHAHQIALASKTGLGTPPQLGQGVVWPSLSHDGGCDSQPGTWCQGYIPYGALFALPPSTNIAAMGLSEAGTRLAQALMDYGLYIVDNGVPSMRADQHIPGAMLTALTSDMRKIYPKMRRILNNAQNQTASGGGTPRAINSAFDAS